MIGLLKNALFSSETFACAVCSLDYTRKQGRKTTRIRSLPNQQLPQSSIHTYSDTEQSISIDRDVQRTNGLPADPAACRAAEVATS